MWTVALSGSLHILASPVSIAELTLNQQIIIWCSICPLQSRFCQCSLVVKTSIKHLIAQISTPTEEPYAFVQRCHMLCRQSIQSVKTRTSANTIHSYVLPQWTHRGVVSGKDTQGSSPLTVALLFQVTAVMSRGNISNKRKTLLVKHLVTVNPLTRNLGTDNTHTLTRISVRKLKPKLKYKSYYPFKNSEFQCTT